MSFGYQFIYMEVALLLGYRARVSSLLGCRDSKKRFMSTTSKLSIYAPFAPLRYSFWCVK
jgi:hypothetical protein